MYSSKKILFWTVGHLKQDPKSCILIVKSGGSVSRRLILNQSRHIQVQPLSPLQQSIWKTVCSIHSMNVLPSSNVVNAGIIWKENLATSLSSWLVIDAAHVVPARNSSDAACITGKVAALGSVYRYEIEVMLISGVGCRG